ncbi:uncharacterized protein [Miscanthus floridulus]|uniref:uncharacterized protein n=1 Tax=Miscanthus floridulus TaxID=154761 RepID=UPI003457B3A8
MAATPAMIDELIEEFLLRLPPTDPASLVDAALVCKSWGRFICSPRFQREFRKFHCKPPMLGFFCNIESAQFFPTSSFHLPQATLRSCIVLDARHGRVLLERNVMEDEDTVLTVWDPTIDEQWDLPQLDIGEQLACYDMETRETYVIHLPLKLGECSTALMEMENGELGVARLDEAAKLTLWSSELNPNRDLEWAQIKVIELEKVLPVNGRSIYSNYIAFAHGAGIFFVGTDDGIFSFDLKSGQAKKVFNDPCVGYGVNIVVPYVSFCTPALRSIDIGEELEVDAEINNSAC